MFFPPGTRPELNTEIVIRDTDYSSYAIMYYQKQGEMTMKLYGGFHSNVIFVWYFRSKSQLVVLVVLFWEIQRVHCGLMLLPECFIFVFCALFAGRSVDNLSEPMLTKFEQLAEKQNLGLAYLFPFPTYSIYALISIENNIHYIMKRNIIRLQLTYFHHQLICGLNPKIFSLLPSRSKETRKYSRERILVFFL